MGPLTMASASALLTTVFGAVKGAMNTHSNVETAKKIKKAIPSKTGPQSLISYTQSLRVEPLCVIDKTVAMNPVASDIMQFVHSAFAGFYLQAIALDNTVDEVEVKERIEKYNPNRHTNSNILAKKTYMLSTESFEVDRMAVALEASTPNLMNKKQNNRERLANETDDEFVERIRKLEKDAKLVSDIKADVNKKDPEPLTPTKYSAGGTDQAFKEIKEETQLGIGKLLTVEIKGSNGTVLDLPVAIKINALSASTRDIVDILSYRQMSPSSAERFNMYKKGHLSLWKDLIFSRDLIKAAKKEMMRDKTGIVHAEAARQTNNFLRAVETMQAGAASLSNIFIISKDTQAQLEGNMGARIDNFKSREEMFATSGMMMFIVVDTEFDRLKVYYQSIPKPADLSFKDLKSSKKDSGGNINDILQSLLLNQPPRL